MELWRRYVLNLIENNESIYFVLFMQCKRWFLKGISSSSLQAQSVIYKFNASYFQNGSNNIENVWTWYRKEIDQM